MSLGVTALGVVAGHRNGDTQAVPAGARKGDTGNVIKGEREVIFDGKAIRTALYDAARAAPGVRLKGPR